MTSVPDSAAVAGTSALSVRDCSTVFVAAEATDAGHWSAVASASLTHDDVVGEAR